jgi:hypothetical protein
MKFKWSLDRDGDVVLKRDDEILGWVLKPHGRGHIPHVRRALIAGMPESEVRFTNNLESLRQAMRALRTRVIVLTIGGRYGP